MQEEGSRQTYDSTSDARVQASLDVPVDNNILAHNYTVLTPEQKAQMRALKDKGLELIKLLHEIGGTDPTGPRQGSVELSVSQTKVREAIMWGVSHVVQSA